MQAIRFLQKALAQALPSIHSRRLRSVMSCVSSLLHGRRLTLTALGRFMTGHAYPKHSIKRADRLLGNQHLRSERPLFYWVMLRALLGSLKHPLILVDWSRIDASGTAFLLRASIPWRCAHFLFMKAFMSARAVPSIKTAYSKRSPNCYQMTASRFWSPMRVFGDRG